MQADILFSAWNIFRKHMKWAHLYHIYVTLNNYVLIGLTLRMKIGWYQYVNVDRKSGFN